MSTDRPMTRDELVAELVALRARLAQVGQELAQANERHGHWAEMAERAHKETTARAEKAEQFREALIDALVINHSYTAEHDTDPRKAVADLIAVETQIALDPAVSGDAQALIDRGRKEAEQENARLREALATAVRFYDERVLIGGSMECVHWLKAARTALGGE